MTVRQALDEGFKRAGTAKTAAPIHLRDGIDKSRYYYLKDFGGPTEIPAHLMDVTEQERYNRSLPNLRRYFQANKLAGINRSKRVLTDLDLSQYQTSTGWAV